MAKMRIAPADRPRVKLECLRMLTGLNLGGEEESLVSSFVDTYLPLNEPEKAKYEAEKAKLLASEKEQVMAIETSWKKEGRIKGRVEGRQEQALETVLLQLNRKLGTLSPELEERIKHFKFN